ncbi:MAG: hypothetical protein RLZZ241_1448 [Bacteroidota bacterium]|jgi:hypothetical protein
MKKSSYLFYVLSVLWFTGCGSDAPGPNPQPEPVKLPPVAGTLIFPENLSECTEGTPVSDSQSSIRFQWSTGANTDSFTLEVTDLETNNRNVVNTQNQEAALTLTRGNAYSWSVTSRNTGTSETAKTATWYFYNAGISTANYAPFPADLTAPISGSVKSPGPVTLYWKGSDLDSEPLSYEVLLNTSNPPESVVGNTNNESFTVALTTTGVYYWRIRSTDPAGNSSLSEIYQFRIE